MPQWKQSLIGGLETGKWADRKWLQNLAAPEPQWKKALIAGL